MFDVLTRASLDGAILVCIVWSVNRAVPALSPAARTALWWCAAAKFVVGLAWTTPVLLPVLPATAPGDPGSRPISRPAASVTGPVGQSTSMMTEGAPRSPVYGMPDLPWARLLAGAWVVGFAVSAGLGLRRWRRMRTAIDRSFAPDPSMLRMAADVGALIGLRRVPMVRMSADVESPLVAGLLRPVILLPAGRFSTMPPEQQRMSVCHEMAHVRRCDVWLGCVPALTERILFFHPLARLATREYAFWREAACDAAVIAALGAAPQAYGRLLLDLGVTSRPAALAPAGAAWSFANLKRRIVMLRRPESPSRPVRVLTVAALCAACAGLAPFQLTARPITASTAILPATVPTLAIEPQSRSARESFRYVLFVNDEHMTMSGSSGDVERARRHRRPGEPMLWFVRGGTEYIVRDPEVLAELQTIWEPVGRIGAEQGEVGARQGQIGAKQGEIGARQGTIGAEQGILGARQGVIGARQAALTVRELRQSTPEDRVEIERERRALDEEMRKLDLEMRALNDRMEKLEQPMRALGDDMEVLGREMEALGKKMENASRKAEAEMRALIDKAVRSGAAQPVR